MKLVNITSPLEDLTIMSLLSCFSMFQDKQGLPWWLGISYKGIGQYDLQDKVKPRKVSVNHFRHLGKH